MQETDSKAPASVNVSSNVLKKAYTGYDYSTQKLSWEFVVNTNKMPMDAATNPEIIDALPMGLTYDMGSAVIKSTTTLDVDLMGWKTVNGKQVPVNPIKLDKNTAWLSRDDYPQGEQQSKVEAVIKDIESPVMTKTGKSQITNGTPTADNCKIDYSVRIN